MKGGSKGLKAFIPSPFSFKTRLGSAVNKGGGGVDGGGTNKQKTEKEMYEQKG